MNTNNTTYSSANATSGHSPASEPSPTNTQVGLERDIDRQRDHIGGLLDALESKLSPGEVFERVLGYGKGGGREFANNLGDTVKANPMPTLLTAAGLMWLYANKDNTAGTHGARGGSSSGGFGRAEHGDEDNGDADGDHGIKQRARDAKDGISEKAGDVKASASDAAHDAMDSARDRARQANDGFHHMLEDNPMAVGAMGIAVGALLGAMLPSTRKEDELLGETRDRLADDAKSLAKRGYERASQAGKDVSTPRDESN